MDPARDHGRSMTGKLTFRGQTEAEGRAAIVAEAQSWIGTKYHPEGRVKGVGTDCGMLVAEVYERAGITPPVPVDHYAYDGHKHSPSEEYLKIILRYGHRIEREAAKPGDVEMFRFGLRRSHGAIIEAWPFVIHATVREGKVWRCDISKHADYNGQEPLFYSYW